jgi:L-lactate dehydrogenase complex protein LldE
MFFPEAVADAESLLRAAGFEVGFPAAQTCCGQPAFNSGHHGAARRVARAFARAFSREAPIVCASGSCATMVAHYLPGLVGCEPFEVWELSAFLDAHGAEPARRNEGRRLAYHDSCHMLRELRIADAPRRLLERSGAELVPLPRPDLCCGFGGTFSVRQPEVSVAMADDKLAGARTADALVTADPGCLMHLRGRADRTNGPRVVHLATALAQGV